MDSALIFLIVMLVLLTGIAAYGGDVLGRKLGKKRLTIFGIRPRITAAIMTALFGMGACLAAIVLLTALSNQHRELIFQGGMVRQELDQRQREVRTLNEDIDRLEGDRASVQGQLLAARTSLSEAETEAAALREEADQYRQQVDGLRTEIASFRAQVAELRQARLDLEAINRRIGDDNRDIQEENDRLMRANLDLDNKVLELDNLIAERENDLSELEQSNQRLQNLVSQLEDAVSITDTQLEATNEELQRRLAELRDLDSQLRRTQADMVAARDELTLARDEILALRAEVNLPRTNTMIMARFDEIGRIEIPFGASRAEVRRQLNALTFRMQEVARERGATRGSSPVAFARSDYYNENDPLDVKIDKLADVISSSPEARVIIASAAQNIFEDEPLVVQFAAEPNPLVFSRGDRIVETVIDGRMTEEAIANAIANFVRSNVSETALRAGMIPVLGSDAPLGEIPREEFNTVVREIRNANRLVRLIVVASADIRAGDQLRVRLDLR